MGRLFRQRDRYLADPQLNKCPFHLALLPIQINQPSMTKRIALIFPLLLTAKLLFAQKPIVNDYTATDKIALQAPDVKTADELAGYINDHFKTDQEKVRAIFIWVASNIEYDLQNMFAINFYEKREEKITKALLNKKGICEHYAAIFNDVCGKTGIKSFVVEGYTKQNGFADYIPHAWCAALVDESWFLFDPTWGSGYVSNGQFVRKINNSYFKASPSALIRSHMPFDYLWQFLNYPVTNQEFYEGQVQANTSKPFFSYPDSIKAYEAQSHIEQLEASAVRVEKNGMKNSLIFDRLRHLKMELEHDRQSTTVGLYNNAVVDYNTGINDFNEFIQYRNKQFSPVKPDAEIRAMLDKADQKLKQAATLLNQIKNPDANLAAIIVTLKKSLEDAATPVREQQEWLKKYFSKSKSGRRSMFYKVTWVRIPLN